ncbi:hypothetical protein [Caballeronia sp. ATUFL_M2_KS44]|uniref:hypothetical protein n=1 Tax=Caballeronia sp. ATUFL_M2_KS44 TaxID=2921767 RepID=UPI002028B080|nr:hypothetical protein [Caballeronia sp. ATUFL_M2_KS44]
MHLLTQRPMIFEGQPSQCWRGDALPYVERPRQAVKPEGGPPRELAKVTPFKLEHVRELLSRGFYASAIAADACLSLAVVEYIGRHPEFIATAARKEPEPPKPAVRRGRPRTSAKRAAAAAMSTAAAPALQSIATATLAIASLATAAVTRSARNAPAPKPAVFKAVAPQNVRAPKLKTLALALGNVEVSEWSRV